jgi:hypothetical protein
VREATRPWLDPLQELPRSSEPRTAPAPFIEYRDRATPDSKFSIVAYHSRPGIVTCPAQPVQRARKGSHMSFRNAACGLFGLTVLLAATPAAAALLSASSGAAITTSASAAQAIDYRPYYHCHGPKRCHGKGNYYKYTPSDEPIVNVCRYGRGCGYNTGWNSPSSRYDYTGRRWGKHRRHRHR